MHQEQKLKLRQFTHYSCSSLTTLAITRLPCAAVWTRPSLQGNTDPGGEIPQIDCKSGSCDFSYKLDIS